MGDDSPNAQIEANLLTGKGLYTSAGTTLQQIKSDLDGLAAGLQSAWIGDAYDAYMQKQDQLAKAVQAGSDVLQQGSVQIGKMYDAYIQADEAQRKAEKEAKAFEIFMAVFMIFTAFLGVVAPILEAADLAFAAGMEAIDTAVDVGEVAADVVDDIEMTEFDTLGITDDPPPGDVPDPAPDLISEDPSPEIDNPPNSDPEAPPAPKTENPAPKPEDGPKPDPTPPGFKDILTKLDELLYGKPTTTGPDKVIAPQEPVEVYMLRPYNDPLPDNSPLLYEDEATIAYLRNGSSTSTPTVGDDPLIFTDENGNFFVGGEPVAAENVPDDLAGLDPSIDQPPESPTLPDTIDQSPEPPTLPDTIDQPPESPTLSDIIDQFPKPPTFSDIADETPDTVEQSRWSLDSADETPAADIVPPKVKFGEDQTQEFDNTEPPNRVPRANDGSKAGPSILKKPDYIEEEGPNDPRITYRVEDILNMDKPNDPSIIKDFEGPSTQDSIGTTTNPKTVKFGEDQSTEFLKDKPPNTIEGLQPPTESPQPGPSVLRRPPPQAPQPGEAGGPIITEADGMTDVTVINGNAMTISTYASDGELVSVLLSRWDEDSGRWILYRATTEDGVMRA